MVEERHAIQSAQADKTWKENQQKRRNRAPRSYSASSREKQLGKIRVASERQPWQRSCKVTGYGGFSRIGAIPVPLRVPSLQA
jgi:hypothetical protein